MTTPLSQTRFDQPGQAQLIDSLSEAQLDELGFGVIGFDAEGAVRLYNKFESHAAALSRERVIGYPIFTNVAPCMNNFMVAQRFADAATTATPLDATIDYVLTLRMRPLKVQLRLLAHPADAVRYVVVRRQP